MGNICKGDGSESTIGEARSMGDRSESTIGEARSRPMGDRSESTIGEARSMGDRSESTIGEARSMGDRSDDATDETCSKGMQVILTMSGIGVLSVDELIPIFYFLHVYDRLRAMRVCKRWHRILCSKEAWSVIDFHEFNRDGYDTLGSARTLEFLKLYAGGSLREIYLDHVSHELVTYLQKNCPNVTTVSQLVPPIRYGGRKDGHDVVGSMWFLPPKVRRYELELEGHFHNDRQVTMLQFFSRCVTLRYLVLKAFSITADMADALKALTNLQEIQIINNGGDTEYPSGDILVHGIGSLTTLKCFRLDMTTDMTDTRNRPMLLSDLVVCIGRWQHLKVLALRGVDCSEATFELMIPGIINLESLELAGDIVTTSAIISIGNHLKKLKFLELGNGFYSDESIRSLQHHPELQKLWIHQDFSHQNELEPAWLDIIFDVLVTLPSLKDVELEGYRLLMLYSKTRYKDIVGVKLDIRNSYEHRFFDRFDRSSLAPGMLD